MCKGKVRGGKGKGEREGGKRERERETEERTYSFMWKIVWCSGVISTNVYKKNRSIQPFNRAHMDMLRWGSQN
jgi:hypothetical protein